MTIKYKIAIGILGAVIVLAIYVVAYPRHIDKLADHDTVAIHMLSTVLHSYKLDHGSYPKSLSELVPKYISNLPKSDCGFEFNYQSPGTHNSKEFDIWVDGCDEKGENFRNW